MPLPLKPGYHFNFDRITRPPYYEMASTEAYTDFYGISFMLSGERLIYSPNFTDIVYAGELVFIPKNVYRRTTYVSDSSYERILIKFTDSMIEDLLENIGKDAYTELCEEHIIRFSKDTHFKIIQIFKLMEEEWNRYDSHSELILKGLLNTLIITCMRERTATADNAHLLVLETQQRYIADAIKYIKTHLRENPSLKETAASLNISASYLAKLFTANLHTPFSTFVLTEKIALARKLLVGTRLSMTEVAMQSGFSSSSYFSDCFKRINSISPLQFRNQQTK